jgi:hypothetical protein
MAILFREQRNFFYYFDNSYLYIAVRSEQFEMGANPMYDLQMLR